jgi:hypothetical protein
MNNPASQRQASGGLAFLYGEIMACGDRHFLPCDIASVCTVAQRQLSVEKNVSNVAGLRPQVAAKPERHVY